MKSACILFSGHIDRYGYGKLGGKGAHRAVYELAIGPIPEGLTIDHLCRNRRCINPLHMEAVTRKVNTLRGIGPSAMHARQTHCRRGHGFTPSNTYLRNGMRHCRKCNCLRAAAYKLRTKS